MQLVQTKINTKVIGIDVLLLGVMCLVPTFSHLTTLSLSALDPMRIALLAGMLLVTDRRNAYLLAVALPLVSCALCGMPTPAKALIMAVELSANVALFSLLSDKMNLKVFPAMLLSIVGAKVVYYALKALVLSPAVLVSTSLWLQLALTMVFAIIFATVIKKRKSDL